jgi:hypothetical protein
MSWDVDEKEFHETFDEMVADPNFGLEGAKAWAWSALEYAQDDKNHAVKDLQRMQETVFRATRFQALAWSVYAWLRATPRRLKYRFFPKHSIKRKTFPNGTTISTVPLAPGMVPEEKIYDADTAPTQTLLESGKRRFSVIVGALTLTPRNHKRKAPPAEKK